MGSSGSWFAISAISRLKKFSIEKASLSVFVKYRANLSRFSAMLCVLFTLIVFLLS
jgi:hypothetical protein